jgi:acetate kinase
MRVVLARADAGDPTSTLALAVWAHRLRGLIAAMAAAMDGLDALVFTGGIGENAAAIRARVCRDAAWLGVELDEAANEARGPSISRPGSRAAAWVVPTNEELMIAQHTRRLIAGGRP